MFGRRWNLILTPNPNWSASKPEIVEVDDVGSRESSEMNVNDILVGFVKEEGRMGKVHVTRHGSDLWISVELAAGSFTIEPVHDTSFTKGSHIAYRDEDLASGTFMKYCRPSSSSETSGARTCGQYHIPSRPILRYCRQHPLAHEARHRPLVQSN